MKIRNIFITALAGMISLISCEGFLTEYPTTSMSKGSAYQSPEALEANLTAIYSGMRFWTSNQFYLYLCSASLMQEYSGKRTTDDYLQTHDLTMWSTTSSNTNLYSSLYSSVARCNVLLEGLKTSPVNDTFKTKVEAETRMMRALYYFTLTRLYGDLPLVTEPLDDVESCFIKRSQYSDVYRLIVSDLEFAAENAFTVEELGSKGVLDGRACNVAAKALLSSVYLQMACYLDTPQDHFFKYEDPFRRPDFTFCNVSNAEQALVKSLESAREVILSGVYKIEKDYRNLFRWDPKNYPEDYMSKERIFVFNATPTSGTSSFVPWTLWANPQGTAANNIHNGNAGRIRASRWIFQKWAERYGGTLGTVENCEVYVDCPDPRFNASYFHTEVWGVPTGDATNAGQFVRTEVYPAKVKIASSGDPYIRKYFSPGYKVDNGDADFYVMRYAEVLLNAAEAAARLSSTPSDEYGAEAIGYVNQLLSRARASVNDPSSPAAQPADWTSTTYVDSESLVQGIIWERVFELGNEGHEWFDTHRLGATWLLENVCKPLNVFNGQDANLKFWASAFNSTQITEDLEQVRKGLLLAFPEYEIRYNTALSAADQNDYYIK